MKPFVLTVEAERDIDHILDYLAEDSIDAASRVLDAIENAFYKLAKTPISGISEKIWPISGRSSFWFIHT